MTRWFAATAATAVLAGAAPAATDVGPTVVGHESPTRTEPLDIAPPSAADLAAAPAGEELPGKFWSAYFGERPRAFLLDPQGLLNAGDFRDRLAFLKEHAADSRIDLFVFLFKGNQELPGQVRAEELSERYFSSGRPAALVFYHVGAPRQSQMYLSPSLTDVVSATDQRRSLDSAIMLACAKSEPAAQLAAFLDQLSMHIYQMDRMLGGAASARDAAGDAGKKDKNSGKKPSILEKLRPLWEKTAAYRIPAAAAISVLVAVALVTVFLRRRIRYRLPVVNVEPRLGGDHAAGVGAVISFASATVSPASQRESL